MVKTTTVKRHRRKGREVQRHSRVIRETRKGGKKIRSIDINKDKKVDLILEAGIGDEGKGRTEATRNQLTGLFDGRERVKGGDGTKVFRVKKVRTAPGFAKIKNKREMLSRFRAGTVIGRAPKRL